MRHGEQHLHVRRRAKAASAAFASPNARIQMLDRVCMLFSVVMPATTLPQIYETYSTHNAVGVSLWMWVLYCVAVMPWLAYGIVHKSKPLIVLNVLWLVVQVIMIVGVLLYGQSFL